MKEKVIVSMVIYIAGIVLSLVSFFPFRMDAGILTPVVGYIGVVLFVASLLFGIVSLNRGISNEGKLISSRLTALYKFHIPTFVMVLFIINGIIILFNLYPGKDVSMFIVLEIMFFVWLILLFPCVRLQQVYLHNGNQLIVTNFFSKTELKVASIKGISRFSIFFYKIKLDKGVGLKAIVLLPKVTESIDLFTTPKSIGMLKNLMK